MAINFPDPSQQTTYVADSGVTYEFIDGVWKATTFAALGDVRYVNANGDDMTGNLTIATDKILLNTDGSASFAGTVDANAVTVNGAAVDTSAEVDAKIAAIPPTDLSSYDTSAEVDAKIAAIPPTDLSSYDTSAEVTAKVAALETSLTDGAPGALDTLNELAASLGDDSNFAGTVTNSLAGKANLSGATFTGDVTASGNVGIGTTNPVVPFVLSDDGNKNLEMGYDSSNTEQYIQSYDRGTSAYTQLALAGNAIRFKTSAEAMRIDSSGRLLVGTSTEGHADADDLTLQASSGYTGITLRSGTTAGGAIYFSDATSGSGEYDGYITYSQNSQAFSFGTAGNGSPRMLIDSSGNVGVGTASPIAKLDVRGIAYIGTSLGIDIPSPGDYHANANSLVTSGGITLANATMGSIFFADSATGTGEYVAQINYDHGSDFMQFVTNNAEAMRIDSSGRLLVGLTSGSGEPIAAFQGRSNDANDSGIVAISKTGTNPSGSIGELRFATGSDLNKYYGTILCQSDGSTTSTSLPGLIRFNTTASGATSPTERMRIDSSGSVQITMGGSGYATLFRYGANEDNYIRNGASGFTSFGNHNGTEAMRINSSGSLLVGTTSASSFPDRLITAGDHSRQSSYIDIRSSVTGALLFADGLSGNTAYRGQVEYRHDIDSMLFYTAATERMRITSAGNIQAHGTSDSARIIPATDNVGYLGESTSRWQAVFAVNGTIQTSDERQKTNIEDSNLGYDFVKALRPVSYKWIDGGNNLTYNEEGELEYQAVPGQRKHYGFIAQEVKQAVGINDFGGWIIDDLEDVDSVQSLRYSEFIAPLTKALQEAIAKIETLEQRLSDAGIA